MTNFLITGGAGSLGRILMEKLAVEGNTIRVYDYDEYGLSQLSELIPKGFLLRRIHGDISDRNHLSRAIRGVDVVIHCAAMKNLEIAEYNLQSLLKTNVEGTHNVVTLCQDMGVKTAIFISSDKAATGTSVYGITKRLGEMIWKWGYLTSPGTVFLTLRSGNFCESRGNVFEKWDNELYWGRELSLTDPEMKRYFIKTQDVADLVIRMATNAGSAPFYSGRVIIPRMKEYKMIDLLHKYYPDAQYKIIGKRTGESLSEELLCRFDHVALQMGDITVVDP